MSTSPLSSTAKLAPKQIRFCEEYLIDLNATQAAIRAGYSSKTAGQIGERLLKKVEIHTRITALMAERSKRTEITADFVLDGLKEVAQRCLAAKPVMEWNYSTKSLVQKKDADDRGVWEFDSSGANRSLELLGKHLKLFTDKTENNNTNINYNSEPLSIEKIKQINEALENEY